MPSPSSRPSHALLALLMVSGALACRTPLPPAVQPYTVTPDADFRSQRPAPWEEQAALADVDVQEFRLANGLKVYVVEEPQVPLVSVAYVNRAGEFETGGQTGLPTLTARLVTLDTLLPDGTIISDIQIGGVEPYASVGYAGTAIGFTLVSSGTRVAIETLASIVQRPVFDPNKVGGVQIAMGNELFDEGMNLFGLGNVLTSRAILGEDHPWSAEPRQQIKSLAEFKLADVREFYQRRYRPEESAVIVVGDVSRKEIQPIIERSFGSWQPEEQERKPQTAADVQEISAAPPVGGGTRRVYALLAGGDLAYVVLPQHTVPPGHPDSVPLQLVSQVLAGGFTSRAYQSLRHESGLTYGVSIDEVGSGRDAYMCIRTFFPQTQLREGIRKMDAVLDRLRREPVSEAELAAARTAYLSRLGSARGTHAGAVGLVGSLFFNDQTPQDLRTLEQQVRDATPADLQRVAQRYLRANANLVVISNWFDYGSQLTGVGRVELFEPKRRR